MAPSAEIEAPSALKAGAQKGATVNLFDMPELMRGAQSSSNPAQREDFERRCRQLYRDSVDEENAQRAELNTESVVTAADLEAMFPLLDAVLVRSIAADVPTSQHAIETLLALNDAMSEPVVGGPRATTPPPRDLGVEDHGKFPSLLDADGWQVASQRDFERDPNEDLGSVWRDRARVAKDMPAAKLAVASAWGAAAAAKRRAKKEREPVADDDTEPAFPLTDYESRQRAGLHRAKNRMQYGRGSRGGKGNGKGGARIGGYNGGDDEGYSEDEACCEAGDP